MMNAVRQRILLPLHETVIRRRKVRTHGRFLQKSQWWTGDQLRAFQWAELQALLHHAYQYVPYWRHIFDNLHITPEDIRTYRDFQSLPITEKRHIKANRPQMSSQGYDGEIWIKSTGGSTGQPLEFGYTPESYDWRVAISRRGYEWAGLEFGVDHVAIWGAAPGDLPFYREWKEALHRRMQGRIIVNAYGFDEPNMAKCIEIINRVKPVTIVGYTTPLYHFAQFVAARGGLQWRPQSAISAAETLFDHQREAIEQAFGCKVFNTYGSREFMLIAAECGAEPGLHLSTENLFVEILKDDGTPAGPGELGDLVISDLHNLGMPFIRYRIGDMAEADLRPCKCGRGLPRVARVVGRRLDAIRTADGKIVPGEFFFHLFQEVPWIRQFQVIQETLDKMTIKIVRDDAHASERNLDPIVHELASVFGPTLGVQIDFVESIPLTRTDKFRVTISHVEQTTGDAH